MNDLSSPSIKSSIKDPFSLRHLEMTATSRLSSAK